MRLDEEPASAQEVNGNERHERENDGLACEKDRIWEQAGLPLVHRRKRARSVKVDDQLSGDPAGEEKSEKSEEDAVNRGVSYDHCR